MQRVKISYILRTCLVNFRRAIVILLSNVGGRVLNQEALQNFADGQDRKNMDKEYLSKLLAEEAYDTKGKCCNKL